MTLSLFASTSAFAGNASAPTQVVVTNTPAQPVPMVGLVTDADNPARQPFQWFGFFGQAARATSLFKVVTADPSHRLVIEDVSGRCSGGINEVALGTAIKNHSVYQYHFLPAAFSNGTGAGNVFQTVIIRCPRTCTHMQASRNLCRFRIVHDPKF
jgi:hypothetical protein